MATRNTKDSKTRRASKPYASASKPAHQNRNASGDSVPDTSPSSSIPSTDSPASRMKPLRYWNTLMAKKFNPNIVPRDDIELTLLLMPWKGTEEEFRAHAETEKRKTASIIRGNGTIADALLRLEESTRKTMDAPSVAMIGHKPGDYTLEELGEEEEDIRIRSIPDSEYSVRLYGTATASHRAFTLDIVRTSTEEPVNSSEAGIELWNSPNYDRPFAMGGEGRMRSLQQTFHLKNGKEPIGPGLENFMVLEGSACVLKRRGKRDVYFAIPERPRPSPVLHHMDILKFD